MLDLQPFQPDAALGPLLIDGRTSEPRLNTTAEQKNLAVAHILQTLQNVPGGETEARAQIIWSRGEPTILTVSARIEHLNGQRVWIEDHTSETSLTGGEIHENEETRSRRLRVEVEDLAERGMI